MPLAFELKQGAWGVMLPKVFVTCTRFTLHFAVIFIFFKKKIYYELLISRKYN